jgi:hypothetical protein
MVWAHVGSCQHLADFFAEHVQGRAVVEPDRDVALALADDVFTARRAALGEGGGDGDLGIEQNAGQRAFHHAVGDLRIARARGCQSANQKTAAYCFTQFANELR